MEKRPLRNGSEGDDPARSGDLDWRLRRAFLNSSMRQLSGTATPFRKVVVDAGDYTVWRDHFNAASLPLTGDYNHDGKVDAADYVFWRDSLGSTTNLAADGNGNGMIDSGDYDVWKSNFGNHSSSGAGATAAVPEPASMVLILAGAMTLLIRRRAAVS